MNSIKINPELLFEINNASLTRDNDMHLEVQRYNTIARKSYFSVRVVVYWYRLPASVVSSKTIDSFKSRLDQYFRETGLLQVCVFLNHSRSTATER